MRAHVARANPHWRGIDGVEALLVVSPADAYVSPRWYPSKVEHGKVVPTWNYEVVHLHGTVAIHDDADWKRAMVDDLTDHNEALVPAGAGIVPWQVSDAPVDFIDTQLKAIVGVEITVSGILVVRRSRPDFRARHANRLRRRAPPTQPIAAPHRASAGAVVFLAAATGRVPGRSSRSFRW